MSTQSIELPKVHLKLWGAGENVYTSVVPSCIANTIAEKFWAPLHKHCIKLAWPKSEVDAKEEDKVLGWVDVHHLCKIRIRSEYYPR